MHRLPVPPSRQAEEEEAQMSILLRTEVERRLDATRARLRSSTCDNDRCRAEHPWHGIGDFSVQAVMDLAETALHYIDRTPDPDLGEQK